MIQDRLRKSTSIALLQCAYAHGVHVKRGSEGDSAMDHQLTIGSHLQSVICVYCQLCECVCAVRGRAARGGVLKLIAFASFMTQTERDVAKISTVLRISDSNSSHALVMLSRRGIPSTGSHPLQSS